MLWRTHTAVGVGAASFFTIEPTALAIAGFMSILPDLDQPFGHRGWFSHSFLAAMIFGAVALLASMFNLLYGWVSLLAVSAHILLDFLTKSGVPLLFPMVKGDKGLRIAESKSLVLNKVFLVIGLLMLAVNAGGPAISKALVKAGLAI
jgi:membrane-bound metal-dependent hydrolase YbcI (DUF457 family)